MPNADKINFGSGNGAFKDIAIGSDNLIDLRELDESVKRKHANMPL